MQELTLQQELQSWAKLPAFMCGFSLLGEHPSEFSTVLTVEVTCPDTLQWPQPVADI